MRITFVLPYAELAGGVRVVAIYARLLRERGHEVTVVSIPRGREGWRQLPRRILERLGIMSPPERSPSHLDGVPVRHHILDRERDVVDSDVPDGDIVIATWWLTAEWVAALSPSKGVKAYFIQHHEVSEDLPRHRVEATWRLPLHKITIAKWLVDVGRELYGVREMYLVENGVDTARFHAPARGKQGRPTLGYVHRGGPYKGAEVVAKTIAMVRAAIPDLRVITFSQDRPSSENPAPAGAEFDFQPSQERIREIYSSMDVFLCGSRSEGFHLPPLEAMACRTPVVSTKVGGAVETVEDGRNGYLLEVGDSAGLADRVGRVLSLDDEGWRRMSGAAWETAQRFDWKTATDKFERALLEIVRVGRSGPAIRAEAALP